MKYARIKQDLYRLEHELMDFGILLEFLYTKPSYEAQIAYVDKKMKDFQDKIDVCRHLLEDLGGTEEDDSS